MTLPGRPGKRGRAAELLQRLLQSPDRRQAAALFRFGRWVLDSSVVASLPMHGDAILLGRLLGATVRGVCQFAYQLANTPAAEIARS